MPRSSRSSSSSSSGSRSSGGSSRSYTDRRLPRTTAVKALVYLTGQDPRKITGVRVYNYDDFETNSYGSGFSGSSWSSQNSQIYLLESRHMHWYGEDDASYHGSYRAKKPKPASGRSSKQGVRDAWSGQQQYNPKTRRHATVEEDDEEEDDEDDYSDSSSNASAHEFAGGPGGGGPAYQPRPGMMPPGMMPPGMMHPGMMHPGMMGQMPGMMPGQQQQQRPPPPPGTFQPVYANRSTPPTRPSTSTPVMHTAQPQTFSRGPPPPPMGRPGGPGGGGGRFVPDANGIKVFIP